MNQFFKKVIQAAHHSTLKRKYIFAYWNEFDNICHNYGLDSQEAKVHFQQLDKKIEKLAYQLKGQGTALIITADHGHADTSDHSKIVRLQDHPQLAETLVMPLSGKARALFCYVRPNKVEQFKNYIETHLSDACDLYKSADLVSEGFFGLFSPHPKLLDRIGDYTLIAKDKYIITDLVPGEVEKIHQTKHGGLSAQEMYVPLVAIP